MAQPIAFSKHTKSPLEALEQFASEAEAARSSAPASGAVIVTVPKADDWQSLFPSEAVQPVAARSDAPRQESVFANLVAPERAPAAPTPRPAAPAARPVRVERRRQPSKADWRRTFAAAVVIPGLVSGGFFGTTAMYRQAAPTEDGQPERTTLASITSLPEMPAASASRRPVVRPSVPNRTTTSRTTLNTPPNARTPATRATRQPARTASAALPAVPSARTPAGSVSGSRPSLPAPTPPVLSLGASAPALAFTSASLTAPPAAPAPAAAIPAPAAPAPRPAPEGADRAAVESLLARYRSAFAALDVRAVQAFWPGVDSNALGNAFAQLQVQKFDFDRCQIDVTGPRATATCMGTARFVPTVGSRNIRVESRRWTFHLVRLGGTWIMERVESR